MPQALGRLHAAKCALMAAFLGVAAPSGAGETSGSWQFSVLLDGKPIGTHRFELTPGDAATSWLRSEARFEVKILGFTAYRYRHRSDEHWSGDCLHSIAANTDDGGDLTAVSGEATAGNLVVTARKGRKSSQAASSGCLLTFAYWNPDHLATQRQLLDQGTGRIEPVTITALSPFTIPVHNTPTAVTGLRITGLKHPIDVWYAAGKRWVGLDTTVDGGRKLTYRLP